MTAASMPLALAAYRLAAAALAPAAPLVLRARARGGKEEPARLPERFGRPSLQRPPGELVWIHGASIGECVSALPLIDALLEQAGRSVLVTSGTVTSAAIMRERLPERAFHQFVPIDTPAAAKRFLDHWRPDAALFVDSELWPNLLSSVHSRGIKLALVNGRMSARAFAGWRRAPKSARSLLSCFDVCLAQDDSSAERLRLLGATDVRMIGNLKADARPQPADPQKLAALADAIGARPILLAASTHPGEDETILPAHDALRSRYPHLLTIIVPRHPARGSEIAMLCGNRMVLRRTEHAVPAAGTAVYIADTIGELPLFYTIAPFAFIGGSLIPHGGQNPLEAAGLERAVMAGPYTDNFISTYESIFAAQGTGRVCSCLEIVDLAANWLADAACAHAAGTAAAGAAAALGGALERTRAAVETLLADARA
ncbi:MAG TPA: 3-deoxy-D-manno-octulosonic acid transferase [Rhizomicrobium sp.]|jgi:3-deoxy-D-manno-octulosonic-acid transferase|nr:3-deoxy-D-manno-octulosonic acid transferase [Rhizomicrobium sp.]